jgi:hypothetical protein
MKTLIVFVVAVLCSAWAAAQNSSFPPEGPVGIGVVSPDPSAILEVYSTEDGVLIPRMKKAARDLIEAPATGLIIYQTDVSPGFYYYTGTTWTAASLINASTSLSNLQSTAANESLVAESNNMLTLGSAETKWNWAYLKQVYVDGDLFVSNGADKSEANTFIGISNNTQNTGKNTVWVGYEAGRSNKTGLANAYVGYRAGRSNLNGSRNCFFGMNAGFSNTFGLKNMFVGANAGKDNNIGLSGTFVGFNSGTKNASGGYNAFYGAYSGISNVTGIQNLYFGARAGQNALGSNNSFVGYASGAQATSVQNCTFIGSLTDATLSTASNGTAIGYSATLNVNNAIVLGNAQVSKLGIGCTPLPDDILDFEATTAKLTIGGVWINASDRKLKNSFEDLRADDILDKVWQLDIQRWHYIADREPVTHIGPVAQEFYQLFQVGDEATISTVDPSGIALLAIQALTERGQQKDATIARQQSEIDGLMRAIAEMSASLEHQGSPVHDSDPQEPQEKQP